MSSSSTLLSDVEVKYLRRAIALADAAVARGDHPFGAIVVARFADDEETIVIESMNSVNTKSDPSAHAELNAIRQLGEYVRANKLRLDDAKRGGKRVEFTLFTSTECCVMCAGAIYWSFLIDRVVYACPESGLAKHAGDDFLCPCRETFARGKRPIRVDGPFLQDEAERAHAEYWPKLFAGGLDAEKAPAVVVDRDALLKAGWKATFAETAGEANAAAAPTSISKTFVFGKFHSAWKFMNECVPFIERANHHPKWINVYNRVEVQLTTHDAKGTVTEKDFQLAQEMERVASEIVRSK